MMSSAGFLALLLAAGDFSSPRIVSGGWRIIHLEPPVSLHAAQGVQGAALGQNSALKAGDRLQLGKGARLVVEDRAGSLEVEGEGLFQLVSRGTYRYAGPRASANADGEVQIEMGGDRIRVAAGLVRIRRSGENLFVESPGQARVKVFTSQGMKVIPPQSGVRFSSGGASPPVRLAPAPVPQAPEQNAELMAFRFVWRPTGTPSSYRLEVAGDDNFHQMLYTAEATESTWAPAMGSLPLGVFYWRVTALDAGGFEGIPSATRSFRVAP